MDKIDETGRNKVREMTDRGDRKIVLMVIQNERQGADRQGDFTDPVDLFRSRFCGRSNNIVGIFEKMVSRTLITGLFRACHRMTANEDILISEAFHSLVDVGLCAADIRDNGTRF